MKHVSEYRWDKTQEVPKDVFPLDYRNMMMVDQYSLIALI